MFPVESIDGFDQCFDREHVHFTFQRHLDLGFVLRGRRRRRMGIEKKTDQAIGELTLSSDIVCSCCNKKKNEILLPVFFLLGSLGFLLRSASSCRLDLKRVDLESHGAETCAKRRKE